MWITKTTSTAEHYIRIKFLSRCSKRFFQKFSTKTTLLNTPRCRYAVVGYRESCRWNSDIDTPPRGLTKQENRLKIDTTHVVLEKFSIRSRSVHTPLWRRVRKGKGKAPISQKLYELLSLQNSSRWNGLRTSFRLRLSQHPLILYLQSHWKPDRARQKNIFTPSPYQKKIIS